MEIQEIHLKETYGDKLFNLDKTDEMYRIGLVSKTYDKISQLQFNSLDIKMGSRCVDIGSGTGSIALHLSQRSEFLDGEVIAMDRFTDILKQRIQPSSNLKIIQHDITTDDYGLFGQFDLVNIRFVLMHLTDRAELLKKIASWVKPGGWLVVSDIIDLTGEMSQNESYKNVMSTMWDVLIGSIGTDKNWSRSLISRFQALGFESIRNEVYLPPIGKGALMSEFWYLTWREMHDRLIDQGKLKPEVLLQAEEELINGSITDLSPGMLTCVGRKPL